MEDKRTQKERMLVGELYIADCPELAEDNTGASPSGWGATIACSLNRLMNVTQC